MKGYFSAPNKALLQSTAVKNTQVSSNLILETGIRTSLKSLGELLNIFTRIKGSLFLNYPNNRLIGSMISQLLKCEYFFLVSFLHIQRNKMNHFALCDIDEWIMKIIINVVFFPDRSTG